MMINEAEIRRLAAQRKVDPMVIDLDYSLGWFLLGLSTTSRDPATLVFKGGTCLRKCYFPDYRFSEDLDFSATRAISPDALEDWFRQTILWITEHDGPDFSIQPIHLEVVDDEYGSESYQARIYYRGPLRWGGSPRTVKLDITRAEKILLPVIQRGLFHLYTDQALFHDSIIHSYSLEEMLAEKIRAVGGQRRFAVSRDLYDIYQLINNHPDLHLVQEILPTKFALRGLQTDQDTVEHMENRRKEFENDWNRRLSYLVVDNAISFDLVWQEILPVLKDIVK